MGNTLHQAGIKKDDHGGGRDQQPQAASVATPDQLQTGVKGDDHGGSRDQQPQVGAAERARNQLQPLGGGHGFETTSMMDRTLLKDVTQESYCWRVRVRITRMSRYMREHEPEKDPRLDFVMLDEQGGMMEGQVSARHVSLFEPLIKEDTVYDVHYFQVDDARPAYRATDHPCMAKFTAHTKLTPQVGPVSERDSFPMYACRLASFDELRTRDNDMVLMSDTVGVMTGVSHVMTVPVKRAPTSIRHVHISNGRETATVALWGPHASQFPAEALHQQAQRGHGSKVCRWYVNPAIPEVIALQKSFAGVPGNVRWFSRSPVRASVEDIWDLNPHETLGNAYDVDIIVRSLVPHEPWWYVGCKGCKTKMVKSGSGYNKCFKCGGTVEETRYRLALLGFDPAHMYEKEPKVAEFVFFGDIGEQLTGTPALELVTARRWTTGYIPPEIAALYGRRYNLKVSVSRGSLRRARISYLVNSMSTLPTPGSVHVHAIQGEQADMRSPAERTSPSMVTQLTVEEENKGVGRCTKFIMTSKATYNFGEASGSAALHTQPTITEVVARAGAKRPHLDDESTDHDASTYKCSAKMDLQKPGVIRRLFTEEETDIYTSN